MGVGVAVGWVICDAVVAISCIIPVGSRLKTMPAKKTTKRAKAAKSPKKSKDLLFLRDIFKRFKANYYIMFGFIAVFLVGILVGVVSAAAVYQSTGDKAAPVAGEQKKEYWLELHRKSQKEFLYSGVPGNKDESELVRTFAVKTGIPGERPTPLPQALGKKYWKIIKKYSSAENPETAPYFLELDVPVEDGVFGPVPYNECNGQCSWQLPGYFGLHGINGDRTRLASDNPGSSGCIRHTDEDITYLYNLLEVDEGVRYYIIDA